MSNRDPYSVLGLAKDADADQIKKAYRKLSREHHPDRGGNEARFKEVNAAHQAVGDPDKRKLFDEFGAESLRPGFDADKARRFRRQFGGGPGGFSFSTDGGGFDIDDIMSMFAGGRGHRPRGPRRGDDIISRLVVSLQEALTGSTRTFTFSTGGKVTVRIPKGVRSGQRLRVPGKGRPGIGGGPAGDLVLEVAVAAHPLVRIDRDDLEMDLPITFLESLAGGTITVRTPTGTVNVKIPPRAESGTRLRLKKRGLPKGGRDTKTGDLYFVLRPTPPTGDAQISSDALKELADAYEAGPDVRIGLDFEE
jgi:curved DNA-binding protein